MTAREQFFADLAHFAMLAALAWVLARAAVGTVRAVAAEVHEGRRQHRRLAFVLADPLRYCLFGHLHDHRDDAAMCEAAHGAGEA